MSTTPITITRQMGLMAEMRAVANNIANAGTTGFRRTDVVFTEHIDATPQGESVSMAVARGGSIDLTQGAISHTGGTYDLAIEGEGFFRLRTPQGDRLTRAGAFSPDAAGNLATPAGHAVLDAGGAPVRIPAEAGHIVISTDGTVTADGQPVGRIGLVRPEETLTLKSEPGPMFATQAELLPVEGSAIRQGHLEGSNVNAVMEITRMIEVQRAYELGQAFLDRESDRRSKLVDTLTR
jgi:flagellar basal-body rod protein FlgF